MKEHPILGKACYLRKKGYSLKEISERLNISKSTASLWLRNVQMSDAGKRRLFDLRKKGLQRSIDTKKTKWKEYISFIEDNCKTLQDVNYLSKDQYKLLLAFLHWTEGSKTERRLIFSNSDPRMIKSYLFLLRQCYSIDNNKLKLVLHLHEYHNRDDQIFFWSKITNIEKDKFSIYHKENMTKRKREGYPGCLQIRYGDVKILDELNIIIKRFVDFIDVAGVG